MQKLSAYVIAAMAAIVFSTPPLNAHRTSSNLTTIVWVETDKNLEITHRLHLHDVQLALRNVIASPTTTIFSPEGQAELILYMTETFALRANSEEPLDLAPIGAEIEGDYVYVYQEVGLATPPKALEVIDLTFIDIYPEQENQVNVERGGTVVSLVYNANVQTFLTATFP